MEIEKTAFRHLLRALRIPEGYAEEVCDEGLLCHTINHLAKKSGEQVRVITENNMVRHHCCPVKSHG